MTEALTAARDLLQGVPLRVRRAIYGVLGLAVVLEAGLRLIAPDLLPDTVGPALLMVFGLSSSLLALANSSQLPPPPPVNLLERDRGESALMTIVLVLVIVVIALFLFGTYR